ncbi:MAG TPA: TA system VapC family ribonuclease toxin [Caulobacteraceae bacterium]
MTALLDVNVLIAMVDPSHVHHELTQSWFERRRPLFWATCPITENGLLRILGHPRYPDSPGPPSAVRSLLRQIRSVEGHRFWPDDISLADEDRIAGLPLQHPRQVTDSYLVALARRHGGQLATLDRGLARATPAAWRTAVEFID